MKRILIISFIITLSVVLYNGNNTLAASIFGSDEVLNSYVDYEEPTDEFGNKPTLIKEEKEKFQSIEETNNNNDENNIFRINKGDSSIHSIIYRSVVNSSANGLSFEPTEDARVKAKYYNKRNTPVFKRCRIKVMNTVREALHKSYLKDVEREEKLYKEYEKSLLEEQEENDIFLLSKFKKNKKIDVVTPAVEDIVIENEENDQNISEEITEEVKPVKLKGKLKRNKGENIVVLDAKDIYYLENEDKVIAKNSAVVKFPRQGIKMVADEFTYQNASNVIEAIGNVKISKGNHDVYCDYVRIDVNEEEISFDNILADATGSEMVAESAKSKDNTLYLFNGYISSRADKRLVMPSRRLKGLSPDNFVSTKEEDKFYLQPYFISEKDTNIEADKVIINAKDDHDVITLKNARVHYGNNKIFKIPSITAFTDKTRSTVEANYPEFGNRSQMGMFLGPGFTFDIPHAGIVKLVPFLNYRSSKLGVGGLARYHSTNNLTELAYGSVKDIWVLKGYQKLDDKLSLRYGMNSFLDEWFLGPRMTKYRMELDYHDNYVIPNSLKEGLNLEYEHDFTLGYYHNSMYNMNFESFSKGNIGTLRTRYMAQIRQELYKHYDKDTLNGYGLDFLLQGSTAVYGTGDTQFIGRAGLGFNSKYKRWQQSIYYYLSGFEDESPLARYDAYRYGTSSLMFVEALKVCKYLSLGWMGVMTLSDDSPNGKQFQENSFLFILGPDDFKITFGYDVVRKRTYLTLGFSLNTTGTKLKYDVMEIKNPDKLSSNDEEKIEELQPEFWLIPEKKASVKRYVNAEIIDLTETQDKEVTD